MVCLQHFRMSDTSSIVCFWLSDFHCLKLCGAHFDNMFTKIVSAIYKIRKPPYKQMSKTR